MDKQKFSSPLSLRDVQIKDAFWKKEMELVRTEVIPCLLYTSYLII